MTAIPVAASGPFCMIVGLIVAIGYPFAIVAGMIVGFVFGVFMRKTLVDK